jgi:hypothetical protein
MAGNFTAVEIRPPCGTFVVDISLDIPCNATGLRVKFRHPWNGGVILGGARKV